MSGHGQMTMADGSVYVGAFDKDAFNGEGRYESSNGDVYAGYFENGRLQGSGTRALAVDRKKIEVHLCCLNCVQSKGIAKAICRTRNRQHLPGSRTTEQGSKETDLQKLLKLVQKIRALVIKPRSRHRKRRDSARRVGVLS